MEIKVVKQVMAESAALAEKVRATLRPRGITTFNLIGAPGAGKTSLLERTFAAAQDWLRPAVIEGDIATTADAERLALFGVPVVQANTGPFGGDCHLGVHFIWAALADLPLDAIRTLFIENVGNLVCPAEFDVGEDQKVAVLSLAEGDDKPLKYPLLFREAAVVVVTKIDLAPYVGADLARLRNNVAAVNGAIPIIELSAATGEGLELWLGYLREALNLSAG